MQIHFKLFIAFLLAVWLFAPAHALVLAGGNGLGNTTAPTNDPGWCHVGWSNVGSVRGSAPGKAPSRAGVIYLCDDWFITTYHAWDLDRPTGVVVGVTCYTVDTNSIIQLTNSITVTTNITVITNLTVITTNTTVSTNMQPIADVALFRVKEKPNLPPLNITTMSPGGLWFEMLLNKTIVMIGNGHPRVNTPSYWTTNWISTTQSDTNAYYSGYGFWPDTTQNILRWGTNQIDRINFTMTMSGGPFGDFWAIKTTFNTNAGPDECQIGPIDSGGGVLYKKQGYWELTGLLSTMLQPDETEPKDVWGIANGGFSFSVDLSWYRDQIMNIIKPNGWPDLVVNNPVTVRTSPDFSVPVSITTRNQGVTVTTNFITALYLIPTNAPNFVVSQVTFTNMGSGQAVTNAYDFTAPTNPGTYYLIARADDSAADSGQVHESYENNNQSRAIVLTVVPVPYSYTTNSSGITITGYTGSVGAVEIPATIKGVSVVEIGTNAFSGNTNITSVTMQNTVKKIGDQAFQSCTSLTNVILSTNLTTLGYGGIGAGAFRDCTRLTRITIPKSVTSMQNWAFGGCISLTNVTFENNLIGYGMFAGCTGLTSITIPTGVNSIGELAFLNCSGLTSLYFKGVPPALGGSNVFNNANNVTVYYLPGTAGWTNPWTGRPTALWIPQIQTGNAGFTAQNRFGFNINWVSGRVVVVEARTNLTGGETWKTVETNTLSADSSLFSDQQSTNYRGRFYRLRLP